MSAITSKLGVKTIGAIYVWIALIVLFSVLEPSIFPTWDTGKQILNGYAITGLIALGLLIPLSAGVYDLSVGAVAGLAGIASAYCLANVSTSPWLAMLAGIVVALAVGGLNALVVVGMKVDSFIGTLATASIVTAVTNAVSGSNTIAENVSGSFQQLFGLDSVGGLTLPVGLMLVGALVLAYLMERTIFGRRLYAVGYDAEVARLGGVDVNRVRVRSLLGASLFAGLAGVCQTAALGAGDPTVGPGFLLPAFAAAVLGATQFRGGRFNPFGTVVAVLLLGTGTVGLLIVGAPAWTPDIFEGALLIIAVSLTHAQSLGALTRLRRRRADVRRPPSDRSGAVSDDVRRRPSAGDARGRPEHA